MTDTPDTPPIGPLPGNPARYGAMQLVAPHLIDDPPVIDALGRHLLLDVARNDKRVLAGEVVETKRAPVVFVTRELDDGTQTHMPVEMGSVFDTTGATAPDAYMLAWEADTTDRIPDPEPVIGVDLDFDDDYRHVRGELRELERLNGGQVIFRHGIEDEVIVRALDDQGEPINYLFAVEITPGEHQVEVLPRTAALVAELDPHAGGDATDATESEGDRS